uniref:Uncharacterized protein n=1 Tax=Avena sativa TaxID=4498 RepID=A0ACD5Z9K4_AVESA
MEGEMQPPTAISKVLDNDDLLIEILVRVGFPTTLVRAALVCKHWLRLVSDTNFLHQFSKLHPPALLGFYIAEGTQLQTPHFVPMLPQPPELDAVMHRTSQGIPTGTYVVHCRNNSILTARREGSGLAFGVHSMLCPERGMAIETSPRRDKTRGGYLYYTGRFLSTEERGIVSYLYVWMGCNFERRKSIAHVYMLHLGDGTWREHRTLSADQLFCVRVEPIPVLVDSKIYMANSQGKRDIVVLDLVASSFSTIQLPQGVEYGILGTITFSRVDDSSGLYLVHTKGLQLRIWLHKGYNWLLVQNICLREACANLRMSDCMVEDEHTDVLWLSQVVDNIEFMFLKMGRFMLYLDIKCRTLHKVYESTKVNPCWSYFLYPCKMIWPPTFPLLQDDPARNAM